MLDQPSPSNFASSSARRASFDLDPSFVPSTDEEFKIAMNSWRWRMFSGQLYKIMIKGDEYEDPNEAAQFILPFNPNHAQQRFLTDIHYRNVILKARQLGFTTLIVIYFLDHALFVPDQRCGIIAHDRDSVTNIFRDKVRFAYDNLPALVRASYPLETANKSELKFAHNNSSIRVGMSMRSGTIHRLLVSEMGKMAAKFPAKAEEVVTGSLPAVPINGIAIIESTAEGQAGDFYDIATKAEANEELVKSGARPRTTTDFRFHFYPWWKEPKYQVDPTYITITDEDHDYFDQIEVEMDTILTMRQRAWYVAKRDGDFSGDQAKMWREMPSKPEECWQQSTEGKYYPKQLTAARLQGRVRALHHVPEVPVHSFWDIGSSDGTGIWLMQIINEEHRFLKYIEGWVESYAHFVKEMDDTGFMWGKHFVPHDADHQRQQTDVVASPVDMLQELKPSWDFVTVPRVARVQHRIDLCRKHFHQAVFDETGTKNGLIHLANYQKSWSTITGTWTDTPLKNDATEAADSFGQWAQAKEAGAFGVTKRSGRRKPKGAMTS